MLGITVLAWPHVLSDYKSALFMMLISKLQSQVPAGPARH